MVVFVHSLGSLWQQKVLPSGGVRVWNTTGIRQGTRVRPCAQVFGQVKFGAKARVELSRSGEISRTTWVTSQLEETKGGRKLTLHARAPRNATADLYLVAVTEELVGELQLDSWDPSTTALISFSGWRSRQEVMLLMRPFAWLRGATGSAVLSVGGVNCDWNVTRW